MSVALGTGRSDEPVRVVRGDWWSVGIGLLLVLAVASAYGLGIPLDVFQTSVPKPWPKTPLGLQIAHHWAAYVATWLVLLLLTVLPAVRSGVSLGQYALGFTVLFAAAWGVLILGSQQILKQDGLEYPFWALILGVVAGNLLRIPSSIESATAQSELFIKISIVLLGANLPFSIVAKSGPRAFVEAAIIVAVGFAVSQVLGRWLKLDDRYLAVLGAGASVCGVSAAIAVGNTVRAKPRQIGYVVSLVVVYGLILIFVLPALVHGFHLSALKAGAWIGGSELADASGAAAAQMVGDAAVKAFSLVKLSRDVLISLVCLIFAVIATAVWDRKAGAGDANHPSLGALVWDRFPKFVIAFIVASILSTWWQSAYGKAFATDFTNNLNALRTWLFTLTFLSIGLNTRFRDLRDVSGKAIAVFTVTVLVNVVVGGLLAAALF
ncbi:YeiH family protein [Alicyclobacillus fructus]|uniref:YeiH family protein n=1 Tax=Alicyclobacillus fructus TaxID=2816082 RepID=UPI002E2DF65B|nr:putative sulfate exporter family transporter [Alicyclobacillus fructus]